MIGELLKRLAVSCDNQPFIATGKLVLVFCADCLKWFKAYKDAGLNPRLPGVGDFLIAVDDAVIAAQNAVIAAEADVGGQTPLIERRMRNKLFFIKVFV